MIKLYLAVIATLFTVSSFAASKIEIKIVDLTNVDRGHSLEACGSAKHSDGKKPLLVTLTHDQSKYTTLTDENGSWCILFKRWNYKGEIAVGAATMDFSEKSQVQGFKK